MTDIRRKTDRRLKDGWFLNGAIGRFDGDGYLYVVDRKTGEVPHPGSRGRAEDIVTAVPLSDERRTGPKR